MGLQVMVDVQGTLMYGKSFDGICVEVDFWNESFGPVFWFFIEVCKLKVVDRNVRRLV